MNDGADDDELELIAVPRADDRRIFATDGEEPMLCDDDPAVTSVLPAGTSAPIRTIYRSRGHFRSFVQRQIDLRREYLYNDLSGEFRLAAVDPNEEAAQLAEAAAATATATDSNETTAAAAAADSSRNGNGMAAGSDGARLASVVRVPGKATHVTFRCTHPRWFEMCFADFRRHKERAAKHRDGRGYLSSALMALGVLLLGYWVYSYWPLWEFLVAVQSSEHYRALGIEPGAPIAEVNKAYRNMIRELHPDRNPGCGQVCVTEMIKVKKAYDFIKGKEEASQLQNQVDGMMQFIVMFLFGDVLVMLLHAGIIFSAFLHRFVFGVLDSDPSHVGRVLKFVVNGVDYVVRGLLLVCGVGHILYSSDRNPLSLLSILYAVVTHAANVRDTVEDVFRYRGLQLWDMAVALGVFVTPAVLGHILPLVVQHFASDASALPEILRAGGRGSGDASVAWNALLALMGTCYVAAAAFAAPPNLVDNFVMMRCVMPIDMVTVVHESKAPAGSAAAAAAAAASSGTTTSNNANKTALTANPNDGLKRVHRATKSSIVWFVAMTILRRDVLAFGLNIPAAYRVAAFAIYGAVFLQMTYLPNEPSIFFDMSFRRAEDAAKRRREMREQLVARNAAAQQQLQRASTSSSSSWFFGLFRFGDSDSASSSSSNAARRRMAPMLAEGEFDFLTCDIVDAASGTLRRTSGGGGEDWLAQPLQAQPWSAAPILRINDTERERLRALDEEPVFWSDLLRLDNWAVVRSQELTTDEKFHDVLCEISRREYGLAMRRVPSASGAPGRRFGIQLVQCETRAFLGVNASEDFILPPPGEHTGHVMTERTRAKVTQAVDAALAAEVPGALAATAFWLVAGALAVGLSLHSSSRATASVPTAATPTSAAASAAASSSRHSQQTRFKATLLYGAEEAYARALELAAQQRGGFTLGECDPVVEAPSGGNPFLGRAASRATPVTATVCRSLLGAGAEARKHAAVVANLFKFNEDFDPRKIAVADFSAFAASSADSARGGASKAKRQQQQSEEQAPRGGGGGGQRRADARSGDNTAPGSKAGKRQAPQQQQQKGSSQHKSRTQQQQQQPPPEPAAEPPTTDVAVPIRRQRREHELTADKRDTTMAAPGDTAADMGIPFFGSDQPPAPSAEDMMDFVKFARELERRQRARGWRPKPSFRPQPLDANGNAVQASSGGGGGASQARGNAQTERIGYGGKGNAVRVTSPTDYADDSGDVYGDASGNVWRPSGNDNGGGGGGGDAGAKRSTQFGLPAHAKAYQSRLMLKMQRHMENEIKAGRLSVGFDGRLVDDNHAVLIEWMLQNDESWEPDPGFAAAGKLGSGGSRAGGGAAGGGGGRLGGPAAEELRRVRGGR